MAKKTKPIIVVDTTATFDDVMFSRTRWTQLLSLCARGKVRLALPVVVLRETARHWESQAMEALIVAQERYDRAVKSRKAFAELGLGSLPEQAPVPDVTIDQKTFYDGLAKRLTTLGVEIVPLPNVEISAILDRDLDGRKPFADSGKGFRDTLIWYSVLALLSGLRKGDTVYFVSNNTRDYCEDGNLHPDLLSEIDASGAELLHVTTLDVLVQTDTMKPLIASLAASGAELEAFLQAGTELRKENVESTVDDLVREALESAAQKLTDEEIQTGAEDTSGLDFTEVAIPREITSPTITAVDVEPDTVEWHAYETYEEGTLLIQAHIDAHVSIEGFVFKADYYGMEDEVMLIDFDWNDHMAFVATSVLARLVFQLRLESAAGTVEYTEFDMAEPLVGSDE